MADRRHVSSTASSTSSKTTAMASSSSSAAVTNRPPAIGNMPHISSPAPTTTDTSATHVLVESHVLYGKPTTVSVGDMRHAYQYLAMLREFVNKTLISEVVTHTQKNQIGTSTDDTLSDAVRRMHDILKANEWWLTQIRSIERGFNHWSQALTAFVTTVLNTADRSFTPVYTHNVSTMGRTRPTTSPDCLHTNSLYATLDEMYTHNSSVDANLAEFAEACKAMTEIVQMWNMVQYSPNNSMGAFDMLLTSMTRARLSLCLMGHVLVGACAGVVEMYFEDESKTIKSVYAPSSPSPTQHLLPEVQIRTEVAPVLKTIFDREFVVDDPLKAVLVHPIVGAFANLDPECTRELLVDLCQCASGQMGPHTLMGDLVMEKVHRAMCARYVVSVAVSPQHAATAEGVLAPADCPEHLQAMLAIRDNTCRLLLSDSIGKKFALMAYARALMREFGLLAIVPKQAPSFIPTYQTLCAYYAAEQLSRPQEASVFVPWVHANVTDHFRPMLVRGIPILSILLTTPLWYENSLPESGRVAGKCNAVFGDHPAHEKVLLVALLQSLKNSTSGDQIVNILSHVLGVDGIGDTRSMSSNVTALAASSLAMLPQSQQQQHRPLIPQASAKSQTNNNIATVSSTAASVAMDVHVIKTTHGTWSGTHVHPRYLFNPDTSSISSPTNAFASLPSLDVWAQGTDYLPVGSAFPQRLPVRLMLFASAWLYIADRLESMLGPAPTYIVPAQTKVKPFERACLFLQYTQIKAKAPNQPIRFGTKLSDEETPALMHTPERMQVALLFIYEMFSCRVGNTTCINIRKAANSFRHIVINKGFWGAATWTTTSNVQDDDNDD